MADERTNPKISERFDIVLERRPNRMLRWRWWATWLAGLAAVIGVSIPYLRGDYTAFEARPVCRAHQHFEMQCSQCHDQRLAPIYRLAGYRSFSVSQAKCRKCHIQNSTDHFVGLTQLRANHCVECHAEHHDETLLKVADQTCIDCHQNTKELKSDTPFADVANWNRHPQIALRAGKPLTAGHLALERGQFSGGAWKDNASIYFSHARHLPQTGGVLIPHTHPEYGSSTTKTKVLTCASCHEMDESGAFMKPINYEKHCAECHTLRFSSKLHPTDSTGSFLNAPLPHASSQIVMGVLRERLMQYINDPRNAGEITKPRPPHKPDPAPLPKTDAEKLKWVEQQLQAVTPIIKQAEGPAQPAGAVPHQQAINPLDRQIRTGCGHCHILTAVKSPPAAAGTLPPLAKWDVEAPRIPSRWLPYARFRHAPHRMEKCTACHYRSRDPDGRTSPVSQSASASDILIPKIETCMECHGDRPRQGTAGVRADCVECHGYHHPAGAQPTRPRTAPIRTNNRAAAD